MVKVGFICEGDSEKMVVESEQFQALLAKYNIECVQPVINARGSGNLLPQHIESFRERLMDNGAEKIIVLTDLDADACITLTRQRITERADQIIIVAVKMIEAWFLADNRAMAMLLRQKTFSFATPEQEENPFQTIKNLLTTHTGRGIGTKPMLVSRMRANGFSLENAASHPVCTSAAYFLDKLKMLGDIT